MFEWTRLRLAKLALAVPVLAGIFFLLLAPWPRAQGLSHEQFILSLAAAIDQTTLTPRERLGLRLFFDSNLSDPAGTACAPGPHPPRALTRHNHTINRGAQGSPFHPIGTTDATTLV